MAGAPQADKRSAGSQELAGAQSSNCVERELVTECLGRLSPCIPPPACRVEQVTPTATIFAPAVSPSSSSSPCTERRVRSRKNGAKPRQQSVQLHQEIRAPQPPSDCGRVLEQTQEA